MQNMYRFNLAGREMVVETGKFAQLANGSVMVRYGDTVILTTATASAKPRDGIDYFPLSVTTKTLRCRWEYSGRFIKREGNPSKKQFLLQSN